MFRNPEPVNTFTGEEYKLYVCVCVCVYICVCVCMYMCYVCLCSFLMHTIFNFKKAKEGRGGWKVEPLTDNGRK